MSYSPENATPLFGHPEDVDSSTLSDGDRHTLLVEWNQTDREYPRDRCIHELFEDQAGLRKEAVALELGGQCMTYNELNRVSDHVAGHLAAFGVKPGDLVALSMDRSIGRVVGLLGILKAGAVYWAPERNLPVERLRYVYKDARPKLVLTGRDATGFPPDLVKSAVIDDLILPPPGPLERSACDRRPEDPAYVSYTSGSTGKPKGVVVPHRGVVRLVRGCDYVSLGPGKP